jgi:hypothetical protein
VIDPRFLVFPGETVCLAGRWLPSVGHYPNCAESCTPTPFGATRAGTRQFDRHKVRHHSPTASTILAWLW